MNAHTHPPSPIRGIFTPNVVPLRDDGSINEPELRRYVRWLIDQGVHGLYPNGSTGEFTRFNVEERRDIVRVVCEECGYHKYRHHIHHQPVTALCRSFARMGP